MLRLSFSPCAVLLCKVARVQDSRDKKKKRKEKKTLFALIKIIVLQIRLESLMARIKELIRNSFFFLDLILVEKRRRD